MVATRERRCCLIPTRYFTTLRRNLHKLCTLNDQSPENFWEVGDVISPRICTLRHMSDLICPPGRINTYSVIKLVLSVYCFFLFKLNVFILLPIITDFLHVRRFVRTASFTWKIKCNIYKTLVKCYVWSIALYGSETWTLRKLER